MRLTFVRRFWTVPLRRDEQGIVLIVVLIVMMLLLGMGLTSLFSGYTNLLTSTNLKLATQARNTAEAGVNEAIYRLSRQEGQAGAIAPDLSNPNWQVEIDFTSGDSNASDGTVSTLQPTADWPDERPPQPVIMRFRKADPTGHPNRVLFYNHTLSPPFQEFDLPAANLPADARPVIQLVSTGLDDRDAERQLIAEVTSTVTFAPPAPLSSGVDVNLNGSGFIDGVNHDHRIYISAGNGTDAIYGDDSSETTDTPITASPIKDSPDDNVNAALGFFTVIVQAYPAGGGGGGSCESGVANPSLNTHPPAAQTPAYRACARQFDKQISATEPTIPAWVGLQWISNPTTFGCTAAPTSHSANPHWHGTNQGYASAIALSSTPTVLRDQTPNTTVWTRGVFTWRNNNENDPTNFPGSSNLIATVPPANTTTNCSSSPSLVCRPSTIATFPTLQQYLGLDDISFQNLLDKPDTTRADLDAGRPPLGFTYIQGNFTFNASTASPGTNDFGLLYVTGNLTINGNQTFKGLIFIEGSLSVSGNPTILGAIMVRGSTDITAGTGNMTLLYSRKAAELGIQAGHPWRILTWEDTAIQGSTYTQ